MGRRSGVGTLAALAVTLAAGVAAASGRAEPVDARVRDAVVRVRRRTQGRADAAVAAGTDLGSVYGLAGVSLALAALGRRGPAVRVALAGGLAWVAAQGAKPLLDRERPYELDGEAAATRIVAEPAGSSWPSGHAAVAAAMAATLAPSLGPVGRAGLAVAAGAVAASRLYVGVHHLSDVAGGAGIGVLSAAAVRAFAPEAVARSRGRGPFRRR